MSESRNDTASVPDESSPFSLRSGPAFYGSLLRRYWKPLVAVVVVMSFFSGLSFLRVSAVGLLIDSFEARGGEETAGSMVESVERVWRFIMPESYPPVTEELDTAEGFNRFLSVLAVSLALVAVILAGTLYLKDYLAQRMNVSMLVDVRKALFNHLTRQSVSYFHEQRCGDLISRTTNDLSVIQVSLRHLCETLVQKPLMILWGLTIAFWIHPLLFLVSVPLYVLIMIPILRARRKVVKHGRRRLEKMSLITEALEQLFSGIRIVKAFGMERRERDAFSETNQAFRRSFLKMCRAKITARSLQELLFNLVLAFLFILGGWLMVRQGGTGITAGTLAAFFATLLLIYPPLRVVSKAWNELHEASPAIERILEILREKPSIRDAPGAHDFPGVRETIAFEEVSFSYAEVPGLDLRGLPASSRLPVLREIDLEVHAGEVIALVGPSGAGKSTLVDLLARFYEPQQGRVIVDGVDIREYRHSSYLEAIAIVSQEPFLFNTTIRENIRYGRQGASDENVEEAAQVANAHDFILEQPEGYDTEIGDRGAKLSGGQRQRLTIARAVLRNAPILILDEATSALDSESESEVQKAIDNLMRRRTTFVIAHRLSTVTGADKIVVLEDGGIVEIGRHEELLSRRGRYHRLYTSQNTDVRTTRGRRSKSAAKTE